MNYYLKIDKAKKKKGYQNPNNSANASNLEGEANDNNDNNTNDSETSSESWTSTSSQENPPKRFQSSKNSKAFNLISTQGFDQICEQRMNNAEFQTKAQQMLVDMQSTHLAFVRSQNFERSVSVGSNTSI